MPLFDLPIELLEEYEPEIFEPEDFDAFWQHTLDDTRQHPLDARFEVVDYGLRTVVAYDVTFNGFGGQPVKGWFLIPAGTIAPLPCIVQFIGYGGGRGTPLDWLQFPSAGFATLVMDTRGQGSAWSPGHTPDSYPATNPHYNGFMTQGILDPMHYYYRRVFTDAVRALEAARSHPLVDTTRIAVTGGSQGGGISIAVGGLVPDVKLVMPDVPFLCNFERAIQITPDAPYTEISRYLSIHRDQEEAVMRTLSYFDGVHFAARCQATCLYSVGLMDTICPPSTVYAAYNRVKAPKQIRVYNYNNHEGGGIFQMVEKIRLAQSTL